MSRGSGDENVNALRWIADRILLEPLPEERGRLELVLAIAIALLELVAPARAAAQLSPPTSRLNIDVPVSMDSSTAARVVLVCADRIAPIDTTPATCITGDDFRLHRGQLHFRRETRDVAGVYRIRFYDAGGRILKAVRVRILPTPQKPRARAIAAA